MRANRSIARAVVPLILAGLSGICAWSQEDRAAPYKIAIFTSSPEDEVSDKVEALRYFCEERVQEFNAEGGIEGAPVELLFLDDRFDAEKTKAIVDRALAEERLIAMLGIVSSTRGEGIAQRVGESGVPLISEISVDSLFADYGNMFSLARSASHATEVFLRFLEQNYDSTIFVGKDGDRYTREFHKVLVDQPDRMTLLGAHWLEDITPESLEPFIAEIRAQNPDVIAMAGYTGGGATILQALADAGIEKPVYAATGSVPSMMQRMDGALYQGDLYQIGPSIPHVDNERLAAVQRKLHLSQNRDHLRRFTSYGMTYRDMLTIMLDAAQNSRKTGPTDLRAAIVSELGELQSGKRIYRGLARNWTFTPERSAAMEGLIHWRPANGGYDLKLFPTQFQETEAGPQSVPVVYTDVDMVRVFAVDSTTKTFDAEFYMAIGSAEDEVGLEHFEFTNAYRGDDSRQPLVSYREMHGQRQSDPFAVGNSPRFYRVSGRFRFQPKLSNYPFDSQLFSISFQPKNTAQPFLVQPPPRRNRDRDFEFEKWKLLGGEKTDYVGWEEDVISTTRDYGSELRTQTFYRFNFTWMAKRNVIDYYLRVVIPLALIVIVAYLSVFIPNSKFESVVAIQVTALLSTIALYLAIPKLDTETATVSDQIFIFTEATIGLMLALSVFRVNAVAREMSILTKILTGVQIFVFPLIGVFVCLYVHDISRSLQ